MAKLKIYTFPDKVLAEKAQPIERVEKTYFKLADDMLETMYEAPGIGLAANQVGILDRIIVVDTEYSTQDLDELEDSKEDIEKELSAGAEIVDGVLVSGKKPLIIINPIITYKEGEILFKEGCLSVPEYQAEVTRAEKIKIEYKTIDGLTKVLSAEGLLSVCLQHEIDHLDGKLFIERLSTIKKELAKKKLIRNRASQEDS